MMRRRLIRTKYTGLADRGGAFCDNLNILELECSFGLSDVVPMGPPRQYSLCGAKFIARSLRDQAFFALAMYEFRFVRSPQIKMTLIISNQVGGTYKYRVIRCQTIDVTFDLDEMALLWQWSFLDVVRSREAVISWTNDELTRIFWFVYGIRLTI